MATRSIRNAQRSRSSVTRMRPWWGKDNLFRKWAPPANEVPFFTPATGTAGAPSVLVGGAWAKTTKVNRKAAGTMGSVDTVAKVAGVWTGV